VNISLFIVFSVKSARVARCWAFFVSAIVNEYLFLFLSTEVIALQVRFVHAYL